MSNIFAIGDIHGCREVLEELIEKVKPEKSDTIIFLGDYIDRGPDSSGVISFIQKLDCNKICLIGNHEFMFMQACFSESLHDAMFNANVSLNNGGLQTLQSYGVEDFQKIEHVIPKEHLEFLNSLVYKHETDTHFFCHAGVHPRFPLSQQDEEDLIWIREGFIGRALKFPKIIVHGHTPYKPYDKVKFEQGRICIDTACVYGYNLSCLNVITNEIFTVENKNAS